MRQIGSDGDVIDALQIELITCECEVIVAEEAAEGLEVVAVGFDRVDRDVSLVRQVIEEIADFGSRLGNEFLRKKTGDGAAKKATTRSTASKKAAEPTDKPKRTRKKTTPATTETNE